LALKQEAFVATAQQVIPHTWPKIRKIAVLTDFSQNADTALRFAAAFARGYAADIVLAHAYLPPSCAYVAPDVKLVYQSLDASRKRWADKLLSKIEVTHLSDIKCAAVLHQGTPKELLKELGDVDLIVVGTSGAKGFEKAALGSTAETIFRSSTVPVLTVGPNCRCHGPDAIVLNTILYATDFSSASDFVLPYAFSIAREHYAHLVLLHVAHENDVPFSFDRAMAGAEPLERLRKLVHVGAGLERQASYVVGFGTPAPQIIQEAKNEQADLIVVGARGPSGLASAVSHLGGGTAYRVAADADCPVLTIRHT
jgi:nucleotide-binding universal stress UspA family protein